MTIANIVADRDRERESSMRSVVLAGSIGTIIEWYDFLVYASMAALVFNKLFFPAADASLGTLAALGTYAVGFFARPLGGALFGHFGDRLGRKSMLMMTMLLMGFATFAIGLLPTYASIGVAAPMLLIALRVIQGIGLGGEWGGASLLVLEHAPSKLRGFFGSLVQIGFPLGLVLSTLIVSFVARLPEAELFSWGWRIPFLLSVILFGIGAFVRSRVAETPVFLEMQAKQALCEKPAIEAITKNGGTFLLAVGLKLTEVSWVYMLTVFIAIYATTRLGLSKAFILDSVLYAALLELITIPLFGGVSDKIGRRPMYILGALFTFLFAFPLFWMLDTKDPGTVMLAIIIGVNLGHALMFAPESTYFPELFKGPVRCTGASFGFQVSAAVGGGLAPILATGMLDRFGTTTGVSCMMIAFGLVTLTAAIFARETRHETL